MGLLNFWRISQVKENLPLLCFSVLQQFESWAYESSHSRKQNQAQFSFQIGCAALSTLKHHPLHSHFAIYWHEVCMRISSGPAQTHPWAWASFALVGPEQKSPSHPPMAWLALCPDELYEAPKLSAGLPAPEHLPWASSKHRASCKPSLGRGLFCAAELWVLL